jgi:hypothetical protein
MVYRRRPARRPARRPRKYNRRYKRTRVARPLNRGNVHHFKRTFQSADISNLTAGASAGAYAPAFTNLPNNTEFSALFDEYRINKVVVKFVPNFTGSDLNPNASFNSLPNIYTILDYDDNNTPANLDELLQYPNMKMTRGHAIHTRIFTPKVCLDVGGSNAVAPKAKQWLDLSFASIPHYGMKWWLDASGVTTGKYRVFITMYFSCRGVR